ncbi:hypothetical protein B0A55_09752 [Friedmanniomyces simplex]|uniref:DUF4484 domain-containing protein n=1 Tax=Friedmanniomyces simplex TaxID=329884 RepID=A0A4V5NF85_9PEZI|nr:hypothetical protein B0A55_09752 [Friedmanniomyces simplex]
MSQDETPAIAALFQVIFDQKIGYTTAWKRSIPDLDLSGVEYKSLPSGLHGVQQDLVYFIHDGQHAGISAFAQQEADQAHRNASFCAVGALVSLSHGRLGKGWLHAPDLRELANGVLKHNDTRALERFWEKHRVDNARARRPSSPDESRESFVLSLKRKRGLSGVSDGLKLGSTIMADHPALYMPGFLDSLGPLLCPLYRAALLRKRILALGSPPVQTNCNGVYILSILSSIPQSAAEVLPPDADALLRPQPLFSVGVADIASLSRNDSRTGWIATSTDDILAEKHQLYDLLVELPESVPGSKRQWPRLRTADGKILKASQRDLRRYRMLRNELKRLRITRRSHEDGAESAEPESDETPMLGSRHMLAEPAADDEMLDGESEVVEPVSWTAAAYSSFLWWASAGSAQEDTEADEETRFERELLDDLPHLQDVMNDDDDLPPTDNGEANRQDAEETATILTSYFHRLTGHFITSLASIVNEADDETEEGVEEDEIAITADDVRAMGLDVWSENDAEFVREMMKSWFGREAVVAAGGVRMCGVRVC